MSSAEGYVLPKPGIPKTIGTLNIIFGVILVLGGFCFGGYLLAIPVFIDFADKQQQQITSRAKAEHETKLKEIDERLAAAKTDEEKKTITAEKDKEIANVPPVMPDLKAMTGMYRNPTIIGYYLGYFGTGILVNLVLFISGIGLVRLSPWGRKLAIWLASFQILRLTVILAISLIVVQPVVIDETKKMFDALEAQAKQNGAPANFGQAMQMSKAMAGMGAVFAAVGYGFCLIYPVLTLCLLNTAGARAACLPKKPPGLPEYPY